MRLREYSMRVYWPLLISIPLMIAAGVSTYASEDAFRLGLVWLAAVVWTMFFFYGYSKNSRLSAFFGTGVSVILSLVVLVLEMVLMPL